MRIGQTSIVYFLAKTVGSALGFLATVYFARLLGAEILGYYALALAVAAWLVVVGRVGITKAATKRMSEGGEPAAYFTASAILIGALGFIVAGIVLLFARYVNVYVGEQVAIFVAVIVLVKLFHNLVEAALEGDSKVHVAGLLQPVQIGSYSLVQIILVVAGFQLIGLLAGYVVGSILIGVIGLWYLSIGFERPRVRHFKSLVGFARYAWLGGLQSRSFKDVDVLVLGIFVPSALVGVYAVAWSIANFLTLFDHAIGKTMFPELSQADAAGNTDAVRGFITDSLAYGGLFVIPGLFGGALIGEQLLAIYGPEFTQGATVLVVLIAASLLYGYQRQLMNALNAVDRPDLSFRISAVFILVNIAANIILIAWLGLIGAAIATAVAAAFGLLLSFFALRSVLEFSTPTDEIGRQILAAIAMSVVVYLGLRITTLVGIANDIVIVIIHVSVGAGVYILVLLSISASFRATVQANSPVEIPWFD